jgi:hypothetical protein
MVQGEALVRIVSRSDATHTGTFDVTINLKCAPGGSGYPTGTLTIKVDMNDSTAQGLITATSIEQVTSTGRVSPMAYVNGRCKAQTAAGQDIPGCRFWLMLADNKRANDPKGTPDVIGFLVFDSSGKRVAYGTGPVLKGDVTVAPTPN